MKQVKKEPDQLQTLATDKMPVSKSGFLYVYTSNEAPQDVFFDNLVVTQATGPLLEVTHYYPFGLTMAGISSNALKGANYPENRKKYNGIEYTSELDLDIYDAQLRNLDPQIGRWNQIDPKIENMEAWSPYASNYDNPIRYKDFLGDEPDGPGDPIKQVGLVTGREYNLTAPTGIGSALQFAGQYVAGTANEIVAGINQNLNPVYAAVNGAQALFTGKDLQSGRAMSTGESSISILSAMPISKTLSMAGKIAGFVESTIANKALQGATKTALQSTAQELVSATQERGTSLTRFLNSMGTDTKRASVFFGWGNKTQLTKSISDFTKAELLENGWTKDKLVKLARSCNEQILKAQARGAVNEAAVVRRNQAMELARTFFGK
ncbi:RHS repeat-associated core domain-containing protein [Chitinophaga eiseniae]|uniref:RHS repeat-associated core domain-containing protein n=1 Tax=Chitinophaga eiseniae TaxID=634771 RepID=A0A1T4U332_9BACT|nr:RHS repeat-associated core domain-containing protein [Chitinophaga eiseniae]